MSDDAEAFTAEENAAITRALSRYRLACTFCDSNKWTFTEYPAEVQVPVNGKKALVLLPLTCDECGHTVFFNLRILGLQVYVDRIVQLRESKR